MVADVAPLMTMIATKALGTCRGLRVLPLPEMDDADPDEQRHREECEAAHPISDFPTGGGQAQRHGERKPEGEYR